MNKKQGVIIVVLLALIVCAGVLATKLNSDLKYVADNDISNGKSTISFNDSSKNVNSNSSNFFEESQIIRDNNSSQMLQNLKTLIDDEHTSKVDRANYSQKYSKLALAKNHQSQIETILKGKGYENVLCYVNDNKVTVIIKSNNKLSQSQLKQIQDVTMDVAHIKDVDIQLKE